TVREERVFDVAHVDPSDPAFSDLQFLRQVLVIGAPNDEMVAHVLERSDNRRATPPTVVQVRHVWARDQLVTALVLPSQDDYAAARSMLPEVGSIYLRQFEEYAHARMFVTRANE